MRKLLTLLTFFSLLVVAYAQSLDAFEINASMPQICYADETFTFRHFSFEEIRENMKCKTNIIKVSTSIQMAIDRMPERLKKSFHGFDGVYIFGKTDEVMIKSDSFPGLVVSNTLFLNEKLFNGEFSLKNRYNTSSYFRLTPKEPGQEYPSFKIINESSLDI